MVFFTISANFFSSKGGKQTTKTGVDGSIWIRITGVSRVRMIERRREKESERIIGWGGFSGVCPKAIYVSEFVFNHFINNEHCKKMCKRV